MQRPDQKTEFVVIQYDRIIRSITLIDVMTKEQLRALRQWLFSTSPGTPAEAKVIQAFTDLIQEHEAMEN